MNNSKPKSNKQNNIKLASQYEVNHYDCITNTKRQ